MYFLKGKYQQTDYVPQKPPINYEENKQNLSVERKKEYNLLMEKVLVLLHLFGVIVLSNPKIACTLSVCILLCIIYDFIHVHLKN